MELTFEALEPDTLFPLNEEDNQSFYISNGIETIGRGNKHLKLDLYKQLSREQLQLRLDENTGLMVKRIGRNPSSMMKSSELKGDREWIVLEKDEEYRLRDGDVISILTTQIPFRIRTSMGKNKRKLETKEEKGRQEINDKEMVWREINSDLFSSPNSLVHCVSEDFRMGKGIALIFLKKFGGIDELLSTNTKKGGVAHLVRDKRTIFYLVTKEKFWNKPDIKDLVSSLYAMKEICMEKGIKSLSMPQIGCGLDGLSWKTVKGKIMEVFEGSGMEITIHSLGKNKEKEEENELDEEPKKKITKSHDWNKLKWKENGTLLYLDSTDISPSSKIAAFDMDGTLIIPSSGAKFPKNEDDWKLLHEEEVRDKIHQLNNEGFKIVIFTNQGGISKGTQKKSDIQGKIIKICKKLGIQMQALVATKEDWYRKPNLGMWGFFCENMNGGTKPDMKKSFFIGDAAGRPGGWVKGRSKDHSCADRTFALNVGLKFQTPEELFLGHSPHPIEKIFWDGIDPASILESSEGKKLNLKRVIGNNDKEMIVCVGFPATGKSSFVKKYLEERGYVRVNRDTLGTKEKCLKAAKMAISNSQSLVIDNTNPSIETRAEYISIAQKAGYPVRCFKFTTDYNLALHLNLFREKITKGETGRVPKIAYNVFKGKFQEPTDDEGFDEIVKIDFIPEFEKEEHKRVFLLRN